MSLRNVVNFYRAARARFGRVHSLWSALMTEAGVRKLLKDQAKRVASPDVDRVMRWPALGGYCSRTSSGEHVPIYDSPGVARCAECGVQDYGQCARNGHRFEYNARGDFKTCTVCGYVRND